MRSTKSKELSQSDLNCDSLIVKVGYMHENRTSINWNTFAMVHESKRLIPATRVDTLSSCLSTADSRLWMSLIASPDYTNLQIWVNNATNETSIKKSNKTSAQVIFIAPECFFNNLTFLSKYFFLNKNCHSAMTVFVKVELPRHAERPWHGLTAWSTISCRRLLSKCLGNAARRLYVDRKTGSVCDIQVCDVKFSSTTIRICFWLTVDFRHSGQSSRNRVTQATSWHKLSN